MLCSWRPSFLTTTSLSSVEVERKLDTFKPKVMVSISPSFYDQLFHAKILFEAFLYLQFWLCNLCWKNNCAKADPKMLMKSTKGVKGTVYILNLDQLLIQQFIFVGKGSSINDITNFLILFIFFVDNSMDCVSNLSLLQESIVPNFVFSRF